MGLENVGQLKRLIKEAIGDRLKMIDEAGNVAAIEAKIGKVEEDMQECVSVKDSLEGMENLKHYVNPKTVNTLTKEIDATLKELDKKRADLEKQKSKMSGGKTATSVVPVDDNGNGLVDDDEAEDAALNEAINNILKSIK